MTNTISVSFYGFDTQECCMADIMLPFSNSKITDIQVKLDAEGEIHVKLPSNLPTTGAFNEIEWEEVKNQIAEEYKRLINEQPITVKFHHFDEKDNCLADITLRDSNTIVTNIKVTSGGAVVRVDMPSWMHKRWSYSEVQWSEVRRIVTREYLAAVSKNDCSHESYLSKDNTRSCTFHSFKMNYRAFADATIISISSRIPNIQLTYDKKTHETKVFMPKGITHWDGSIVEWETLAGVIKSEFTRQIIDDSQESAPVMDDIKIDFRDIQEITACTADIKLPENKNTIKGFRVTRKKGEEKIIISLPKWIKRWNGKKTSWHDLCAFITEEYNTFTEAHRPELSNYIESTTSFNNAERNIATTKSESSIERGQKQQSEDKNEFGRKLNADNSAFIFYPRTVLRPVFFSGGKGKKTKLDLAYALNAGSYGGFGSFEINILEWIAKLRFTTNAMLLDLVKAGYVSFGWRSAISGDKLKRVMERMVDYDLVTLTKFVSLNDDGSPNERNSTIMRIVSLGKNGDILLRELGKHSTGYNPFDVYQDGNTVKRFLTSNQWLVYWLKTYTEEIGEAYETNCIINLKGPEYVGARIYATVTINDCTIVAEPVRRVEDFEIERNKQSLKAKVQRLSMMFDYMDQLYHGNDEINFLQRPIITLICEDDSHILDVYKILQPILPEIKKQEIWFTNDLRVFNYNNRGKRFFRIVNGDMKPIDIKQVLGVDEE